MKIIVTGGNGTMGRALREFLPDATYMSRQECDIANDKRLQAAFDTHQPEVVIHAAALTDHQHPDAGQIIQTNIIGTELVSRWCKAFGAKMVYLSTHYVYPGETGNYKETDATRPIGTYAWSKLAGEGWAQTVPDWLIVRGSWYGPDKLEKFKRGALVDAWCNRTTPSDAARQIASLVFGGATGIYNIGGTRQTFRDLAVRALGQSVVGITRAELRRRIPYDFPKDSSVDTSKFGAFIAGRH
jgi:dTDP-4-dehydrorhamnose reductase